MFKKLASFCAALLLGATVAAGASAAVVTFDDVDAPCCFGGVTPGGLLGPTLTYGPLTINGGVILNGNSGWAGLQTSDPNVYGTSDFLDLADDSLLPGSITMLFSTAQSFVGFDVINGFVAARFSVNVYDALDALIGGATFSLDQYPTAGAVGSVAFSVPGIRKITVESSQAQGQKDFAVDTITHVPEPATVALLGIALAGLAASRRRRQ